MSLLANAPAIVVRDVSKRFRIYRGEADVAQGLLTSRRAGGLALRDVSAGRGDGHRSA